MTRRTTVAVGVAMVVVAAAVRVNNALTFPPLQGYDGFAHFTYVWYLAATGHLPLATGGWAFFHPPLYYAGMALLWKALAPIDALLPLRAGALIVSLLGLVHAAVTWVLVRRILPGRPLVHLLAAGFMLFLPVHLYSAPFLGNEGLTAVLCSLAILVLLALLACPSPARSALLGLLLGLAMLTKFSALPVVAGALATLGLQALRARRLRAGLAQLGIVVAVMLGVCGWYYARNVALHGTPFQMGQGAFMVRHVESMQPRAQRGLAEYLLFDPWIFRRPTWPRGFSLTDDLEGGRHRALREAVWTGLYANTWFDGFGGWVLPRVSASEPARRAGQALLCLGVVPTLLVLYGVWTAVARTWREGWDDTRIALLALLAAMLGLFVAGTRAVPTPAAVKATYLMPITVVFGVLFALGTARLADRWPRALPLVAAECALVAALAVAVFWRGLLFAHSAIAHPVPEFAAVARNAYGVVYYAAGDRDAARARFRAAAAAGWHLGWENLGLLALEEGRPLEALHLLKTARRLQPAQSFGLPEDRRRFDRTTRAEHLNTLAVVYHRLGWHEEALRAARAAHARDGDVPEVHYDLAVLCLLAAPDAGAGRELALRQAKRELERALALDPGFAEARTMLGVTQALAGDCEAAEATWRAAGDACRRRRYPVETGPGTEHAASIGRRRTITDLPQRLGPAHSLEACRRPRAP